PMPTGQILLIKRGAFVLVSVNHGPRRAKTKPRLINATVVRTHARKVRSLAKCSEARCSDGISRCRCLSAIALAKRGRAIHVDLFRIHFSVPQRARHRYNAL